MKDVRNSLIFSVICVAMVIIFIIIIECSLTKETDVMTNNPHNILYLQYKIDSLEKKIKYIENNKLKGKNESGNY